MHVFNYFVFHRFRYNQQFVPALTFIQHFIYYKRLMKSITNDIIFFYRKKSFHLLLHYYTVARSASEPISLSTNSYPLEFHLFPVHSSSGSYGHQFGRVSLSVHTRSNSQSSQRCIGPSTIRPFEEVFTRNSAVFMMKNVFYGG